MALSRPYPDERSQLLHDVAVLGLESQIQALPASRSQEAPMQDTAQMLRLLQLNLDCCSSTSPCRIPRCPRCSTRLARKMRSVLLGRLANAIYHRKRFYLPVTMTCPQWIRSDWYGPQYVEQFMHQLIEHFSDYSSTMITGGWFALDLARSKTSTSTDPTRTKPKGSRGRKVQPSDSEDIKWNVHVHGIVTSTAMRHSLRCLRAFCHEHGVKLTTSHRNYLSPANTADIKKWVKPDELSKWIKYSDKASTQRFVELIDDVMAEVLLNGASRHHDFGELATNVTGQVLQHRCQELIAELSQLPRNWISKSDLARAEDALSQLGTIYGDARGLAESYDMEISSVDDWIRELQQVVGKLFLKLARNTLRQLDDDVRYRVGDTELSGMASYLVAGRKIRRLRRKGKISDWGAIEQLEEFWPATVPDETATSRRSKTWVEQFYKRFAADQLKHIVDMRQVAQYARWEQRHKSRN